MWADPDQREDLLKQLSQFGFDKEQLATLRKMFEADECDLFDLLAFLAFEQPMATRKTRADAVRKNEAYFDHYPRKEAKEFLDFVLHRYEQVGTDELSREMLPTLVELSGLGTTKDVSGAFGGKAINLLQAFKELQKQLYQVA